MILRIILFFLLVQYYSPILFSQDTNVSIYGKNKEYAGKDLNFFIYTERIFDNSVTVAHTKADSSGTFVVSFYLDQTKCIYCQTPLYTAFIFAEPGKSYHVNLPPGATSTEENRNNPFFIPPLWHMLPISDKPGVPVELNAAIDSFNKQFDPFLDKQLLLYYNTQQNNEKLDSFTRAVNKIPVPENNDYYQSYRLYKLATLGFMDKQFSYAGLTDKYLKNKTVPDQVTSWWEFFNLFFDGYLSSLSTKKEYSGLYSLIGSGNYYSLNQILQKDSALQNTSIREWAVLKEIQRIYYQNGLPLDILVNLCDSLAAGTDDKLSIYLAEYIKKEARSLITGNFPPSGVLMNSRGDSLQISSINGKYTYIGFCSLDNIGCQMEFEYLKYLYHKHNRYLELIIIVPQAEKDRIDLFTWENSIPWTFWYPLNTPETFKDFKVKAYPVFFLLDRQGKLIMSPAVLPSAGFEQQLFHILKNRNEI